ncbi:response regulator [Rubripirellula reticaptiva]|uniref:Translational regulator CsrA n=1 Tax=Rubripirellula reticaptiva TaxID=2528013 RepID=A0A5C6F8W1_9BACT|nr:response regulator [Rubripirellula reticaptiva]TWU57775.1 Polar-differentiation response regulator DivK [Rubripirellula reticaptiva]
MLVLSRRAQQQITFPGLDITLSILQVRGRIVKIGIEAPTDIKVKRSEVVDVEVQPNSEFDSLLTSDSEWGEEEHRRRNQLNTLQLLVDAVQLQLRRGDDVDAKRLIGSLLDKLDVANYEISSPDTCQDKTGATAFRQLRVLVVEDSENERGLMTYLLASHGFVVYVARDGAEALSQLRHGCGLPDVVLMDIDMPFGNGIETLQYIRHDVMLSQLMVYAVTGSRRNLDNEPVGRGWDRWFSKPVDVRQLVDAIREDCSTDQLGTHQRTLPSDACKVQP